MTYSTVFTEAWRNIRSRTTGAVVLALTLAATVGGLAALDLVTVAGLQRDSLAFDRSGASTRIVTAEHLVDGADCDRLAESPGIRGAGALRQGRPVTLAAAPGDPIPSYAVSPGLGAVLAVRGAGGSGVWMPTSLARLLGVRDGSTLTTTHGPLRVAGLFDYPEDGRDARLGYALLVPEAPTSAFDECWAASWPARSDLDEALRWTGVVHPGSSTPMTIGQLNNNHGPAYDARAAFDARVTGSSWIGAGLVGLLLGYVAARRRRLEYASGLHAGQSRPAQVLTALIESAVWVGGALGLTISSLAVVAVRVVPEDRRVVLLTAVPSLAVAGAMALTGVLLGVMQTKERHLFTYFKDR